MGIDCTGVTRNIGTLASESQKKHLVTCQAMSFPWGMNYRETPTPRVVFFMPRRSQVGGGLAGGRATPPKMLRQARCSQK